MLCLTHKTNLVPRLEYISLIVEIILIGEGKARIYVYTRYQIFGIIKFMLNIKVSGLTRKNVFKCFLLTKPLEPCITELANYV